MRILGLGHYSRTGKDTLANYFVDFFKDTSICVLKRSFAWKLKQVTFELYAWAGMREPEYYETEEGAKARTVVLPAIGKTPIDIWVDFGTPAVRQCVYDRTWIDYLLKSDLNADMLVIPDVRFPNEVAAIRDMGGILVKVVRPGYGPKNTVADRALIGRDVWDYVVGAEGSMKSLDQWAVRLASGFLGVSSMPIQRYEDKMRALSVEVL